VSGAKLEQPPHVRPEPDWLISQAESNGIAVLRHPGGHGKSRRLLSISVFVALAGLGEIGGEC
jgi:hypothetical protein